MAPNKDNYTDPTQRPHEEGPERPRTLMKRISLGFSSFRANTPLRKARPDSKTKSRPKTAPADRLTYDKLHRPLGLPDSQQISIPRIAIPKLSESDSDCPYDPSSYHSFSSTKQNKCACCGLRPASRATSNRPCSHCRSRTPFSHLASTLKWPRGQHGKSPVQSSLAQLIESSASSEEVPRVVSTAVAAKRSGNRPRRSSLPDKRIPSCSSSHLPSTYEADTSEQQGGIAHAFSRGGSARRDTRPVSPKLHHLHGLPDAKYHPFVHRCEVDAHLAALRAGSPSPLCDSIDEGRTVVGPEEPYLDFSRTVYYGTTTHWGPIRHSYEDHLSPPSGPRYTSTIIDRIQIGGNIVIEEGRRGGIPSWERELERSGVYRQSSPEPNTPPLLPQPVADDDSFSTLTTQTPSIVGGKRIELLGGNEPPKLRGGSGSLHASIGFNLKKWLLTCHGPCPSRDTDSDADLVPPRAPVPKHITRALRTSRGTAALPVHLAKSSAETSQPNSSAPPFVQSNSALESIHHNTPPTNQTSFENRESQPLISTIPTLRGGAGSDVRLPPTLYWLAGGRGKPVTIRSWQKQRGRKRIGGLWGWRCMVQERERSMRFRVDVVELTRVGRVQVLGLRVLLWVMGEGKSVFREKKGWKHLLKELGRWE
jgi:hypothetical protein